MRSPCSPRCSCLGTCPTPWGGGRIFAALVLLLLSLGVFIGARSVVWLIAARLLQGFATGLLTAAASASMLDLEPGGRPGLAALANVVAAMAGQAVGALGSGALVQYAPDPLRLVYIVVLVAVLVVGVAAVRADPRDRGDPTRLHRPHPSRRSARGATRLPGRRAVPDRDLGAQQLLPLARTESHADPRRQRQPTHRRERSGDPARRRHGVGDRRAWARRPSADARGMRRACRRRRAGRAGPRPAEHADLQRQHLRRRARPRNGVLGRPARAVGAGRGRRPGRARRDDLRRGLRLFSVRR